MISLIAAIGKNNELGKNNSLLWSLPADMKHFREKTQGHTVIMGRKTFESIGKPLPKRRNIIITRDKNYISHGVDVVNSLENAIESAKTSLVENEEIFIIGGAEIYKQAMPLADRLYITHIEATDNDADSFFPEIDKDIWQKINEKRYLSDTENPLSYSFTTYQKI